MSRFVYGARANLPAYVETGGSTYRIVADHLGSVRLVIDTATEAVVQRMDYDEFGRVTLDTNPGFQPFGIAGGLYEAQTGLVRFGARDYDPEVGRWTAKDPIGFAGHDPGLYSYVGNDPVNSLDAWGLYSFDEFLQDSAHFSAGFGDTITFGGTRLIRQWMGVDYVVNRCSGLYSAGEVAGIAHSIAVGGAAGVRAGAKSAGREFSHYIPKRSYSGPLHRSFLNGNHVSVRFHALTDPFRYRFMPTAWKRANPILPALLRQAARVPWVYPGAGAGAAYGLGGAKTNDD